MIHPSHKMRYSDSSLYDEVCEICNLADYGVGDKLLELPCTHVWNTAVHATHCCNVCGCKYGDADCPVANGATPPEYECQDCKESREHLVDTLSALGESELEALLLEVMNRKIAVLDSIKGKHDC